MGHSKSQHSYSHRVDDGVPLFLDEGPIAFMDGECALCSWGARLIARYDTKAEIRICPIQTKLGQTVLTHHNLCPNDPDSWLYLENGRAYTSLDAVIRIGARIGGVGWLLQPLRLLPIRTQHWLYVRIARNRYALFGRVDLCAIPDQKLKDRLILE